MQKFIIGLLLGASLLGLNGCATVGAVQNGSMDYDFLDSYGEYKALRRNNDIYLENLDGSISQKKTNTPNIWENECSFRANGKYLIYSEELPDNQKKFYVQDTSTYWVVDRREITEKEFLSFK